MRVALLLAIASGLVARAASGCEPPPTPQFFTIEHQVFGEIGERRASFSCDGGTLVVEIEEDIEVNVALVPAFERTATYRQTWRDGELITFRGEVMDSEGASWVRASRVDGIVRIESEDGQAEAPPSVVPDLPWSRVIATRPLAFDPDTGTLLHLRGSTLGLEQLTYAGRPVEARKIAVRGDRDRDLWFSEEGLLKSRFVARGARITLHRRAYSPR